jgi:hypothetical protein
MLKPATLIVILRYPHRKQIKKKDYESQLLTYPMLNNEIKKIKQLKKWYKKRLESTQVNPLSTIPRSWGWNNIIESKENKSESNS